MLTDTAGWTLEPFEEFRQLQRDMNRLFSGATPQREAYPALNIYANDDQAVVTAELSGIDPKQLGINVNGNRLTVEGERKIEDLTDGVICHRRERGEGRFARTILLPFNVESDKVTAAYRNGVLTVTLPREESAKPRKIEITAG